MLISIAAAREGIPFPAVIEALMMEFLFEGLRKRAFGYQNPLDQQLALWGTCYRASCCASRYYFRTFSYCCGDNRYCVICVPALQLRTAYRMLRFPMLLLAGMLGLYGIAISTLAILIHLTNIRSFGIPYLSPVAPQTPRDLKDVFSERLVGI